MAKLLLPLIIAAWVSAIAILAVQNAAPVSLRFLTLTSIQMPFGVVLAFSAAIGMLATSIAGPLWQRLGKRKKRQSRRS